ncbi:MAG: alpha/beta hydrolase [Gammaproteobacteria bacterium]|nr:alpha/beta hydrolase [Gammaproteobacteria bacterium]
MRILFTVFALLIMAGQSFANEVRLPHQGLTVHAELVKADTDWKQKPVILMTHGTLAHNRMEIINTLQTVFKDRGYSSLAINLSLGLSARKGMYDCSAPHTHKHTDALDEIGLWLSWLKQQGVKSVVLLGHSRGGNQTAWFASERDNEAIQSVLLVAPQTWSQEYASKDYKKRYGKDLDTLLTKAKRMVQQGKGQEFLKPVDFIYCKDTSATADAFVNYYTPDLRMDTPHLLNKLNKPVLVFAGSADTVVKGLDKKMASSVKRANVHLEVLEGADHFFRDLYAEDLADMAVEFIEGQE